MNAGEQPLIKSAVRNRTMIQGRITHQIDINGLSWRELAETAEFRGIPQGTLYSIYKTGKIPRKWWARLKVKAEIETSRVSISKTDMESAAGTIYRNIDTELVSDLIDFLLFKEQ